jgi:hypothetical protein
MSPYSCISVRTYFYELCDEERRRRNVVVQVDEPDRVTYTNTHRLALAHAHADAAHTQTHEHTARTSHHTQTATSDDGDRSVLLHVVVDERVVHSNAVGMYVCVYIYS